MSSRGGLLHYLSTPAPTASARRGEAAAGGHEPNISGLLGEDALKLIGSYASDSANGNNAGLPGSSVKSLEEAAKALVDLIHAQTT